MTTATSIIYSDDLNQISSHQQVLDIVRATDQYRCAPFGKERKFQAQDLRHKKGKWQVLDNGQWYSAFNCCP